MYIFKRKKKKIRGINFHGKAQKRKFLAAKFLTLKEPPQPFHCFLVVLLRKRLAFLTYLSLDHDSGSCDIIGNIIPIGHSYVTDMCQYKCDCVAHDKFTCQPFKCPPKVRVQCAHNMRLIIRKERIKENRSCKCPVVRCVPKWTPPS